MDAVGIDTITDYCQEVVSNVQKYYTGLDDVEKIVALGATTFVTLSSLYLLFGGIGKKPKKNNNKAPRRIKIKKEKKVVVDPYQFAQDVLKDADKQLKEKYIPLVDQLEKDIKDKEYVEPTVYKETKAYRVAYLNETLLKLMMKIDSIDPYACGPEKEEQVRAERKVSIKAIQQQCKRVDELAKHK